MKAIRTMGRSRLLLALALVIVVGFFWYWQAPGNKLSTSEINSYLERMDASLPMGAAEKAEFRVPASKLIRPRKSRSGLWRSGSLTRSCDTF